MARIHRFDTPLFTPLRRYDTVRASIRLRGFCQGFDTELQNGQAAQGFRVLGTNGAIIEEPTGPDWTRWLEVVLLVENMIIRGLVESIRQIQQLKNSNYPTILSI